tara:strand:+ start:54 stop:200 length:147 start_codon:yes stop_codon:yes gene_type:complete
MYINNEPPLCGGFLVGENDGDQVQKRTFIKKNYTCTIQVTPLSKDLLA